MADTHETIVDIIAEKRRDADYIEETARGSLKAGENYDGIAYTESDLESALDFADTKRKEADRLEAAHKREIDVLKQRRTELNAEVAAKDAVIMRLNDAIAEEQKRHLATTENPSAVGDAAKLREAVCEILSYIESFHKYITPGKGKKLTALFAVADTIRNKARAALAAPPRNCDKYPTFNDAIRALADKRGWHDEKWDSERYCILASWLFAPATEKEGGKDGK